MRTLLICALCACTFLSFAQSEPPFQSGAVIEKGIQLHNNQQYQKAIELFQTVPRNDTNYVRALYETALSYTQDSNFVQAIATCDRGLAHKDPDYELLLLEAKASALDDLGKTAEALQVYDEALRTYPQSQSLLLNKSVTLLRASRVDEAEAILQKLVLRNPYLSGAHLRLASCALQKGRVVPAVMSLFTCLLVHPEGPYHTSAIKLLNIISKVTDEITTLVEERKEGETSFAQAEQILLSKISFDKGYKLKASLDDPIVRQVQALMEVVQYNADDADFWMQYYTPLLKQAFRNDIFEPAIYFAFSAVELENIQRYVKKNGKGIREAKSDLVKFFNQIRFTQELSFAKRASAPVLYHYNDDDVLLAKGRTDEKDNPVGPWEYYHKNGNLRVSGLFTEASEKNGPWVYYFSDGLFNGVEHWKNGKLQGEDLTYNRDSVLITQANYKEGKLEGSKKTFYALGHIKTSSGYKEDRKNGLYTEYYSSGRKRTEATYQNDSLQGEYRSYYADGQVQTIARYQNGRLHGLYQDFHKNGRPSFEGTYKNGELEGEAKNFHANGKLKELRTFSAGKMEGEDKDYNDEGVLISLVPYQKGKAQGLAQYYDKDGKLYSTFQFDNDVLKLARYFDKWGKEVSNSTRRNKTFELTLLNAQGIKTAFRTYNDAGLSIGKHFIYYPSGAVKETNDYREGELQGQSTGFHINGKKVYDISYSNNEKNGPALYYYPSGQLKTKGWHKDDSQEGDWTEYTEKGKIKEKYSYRDGDLTGFYEYYHENGVLDYEEEYRYGYLTALHQYDTTGKKIHSVAFKRGTGTYNSIFPNGNKRFEGAYVQGDFHGPFTAYYFDGSKRVEKNYDHGLLHGAYANYHWGGQVATKGQYKGGAPSGAWTYYTAAGKLWKEESYADGELNGLVKHYHANGVLETEAVYKNDERHGAFTRYAEDGSLNGVFYYDEGEITAYTYNDKNGKLLPPIPLPAATGKVKTYYSNGQLASEMEYKDGKTHNLFALYFPGGKLWYSLADEYSVSSGKQVEYFSSGKLKSEYNYWQDNVDGPAKDYHENGNIKEEGVYHNGQAQGEFNYYDAQGRLVEKRFYYYGTLLNVRK